MIPNESHTRLLILDRVQYYGLRSVLKLMRSTPITVLLSENEESPLEFRRFLLSPQRISKSVAYENPTYYHASFRRHVQYWPESSIPPILRAFHMTLFPKYLLFQ